MNFTQSYVFNFFNSTIFRTNSACEIMNYPDFRKMKGEKSSFLGHESILSYLNDYADHFQVRKFIQVRYHKLIMEISEN